MCPHKVRLSPPESAEKRSSADTGADSGGQWRTQADPIGSAADSGGQLSASFSALHLQRDFVLIKGSAYNRFTATLLDPAGCHGNDIVDVSKLLDVLKCTRRLSRPLN